MLDLSWINEQIDRLMHGTRCTQTVRDLAAFIIVRDTMAKGEGDFPSPHLDDMPSKHDSMLNSTPTIDQVERALGAVMVNTPEDKQRAEDMNTWLQILRPEG